MRHVIELILKQYLDSVLDVPVLLEHKTGVTVPYVLLDKTGGSESNHLKKATVAIQSYGTSLYSAAKLNEDVIRAMDGLTTVENVGGAHLNGSYNFTDTETKNYRYQAVYDINYL